MSEEKRAMKTKSLIRRGYSSSSSKARSAIETVVGRGRIRSGCQDFPKRASHEGASIECGNVRATTPWPISDCRGVPLAKFRQRYPETDTHSFFFLSVWLRFFFFFGGLSGTRSRRHLYLVRPPHPPTPSDSSGSRLRKRGFTTIRIQNFRYLDRLRIFPSIHKSNRKSAVTSSHAAICTRGRFHLSVATLTILSFHRC